MDALEHSLISAQIDKFEAEIESLGKGAKKKGKPSDVRIHVYMNTVHHRFNHSERKSSQNGSASTSFTSTSWRCVGQSN